MICYKTIELNSKFVFKMFSLYYLYVTEKCFISGELSMFLPVAGESELLAMSQEKEMPETLTGECVAFISMELSP